LHVHVWINIIIYVSGVPHQPLDGPSHKSRRKMDKFVCSQCGKQLATKSGLSRHEHSHNNSHLLRCSPCQKTFSNLGHYKGHMNSHHASRPYSCKRCHARYTYKSSLFRHEVQCKDPAEGSQSLTIKPRIFKCDQCQQTFTRKDGLRDHINGKHRMIARYNCQKCGAFFQWRSSYKKHKDSLSCKSWWKEIDWLLIHVQDCSMCLWTNFIFTLYLL
jgi:KRAB domain-containing zinc finger protein